MIDRIDPIYCDRCGTSRNVQMHHRKYRSRGGSDDPKNLVPLCRVCHFDVHSHKPGTEKWRTHRWQEEGQTEADA